MRNRIQCARLLAFAFMVSVAAHAQWLNYREPGVPRSPAQLPSRAGSAEARNRSARSRPFLIPSDPRLYSHSILSLTRCGLSLSPLPAFAIPYSPAYRCRRALAPWCDRPRSRGRRPVSIPWRGTDGWSGIRGPLRGCAGCARANLARSSCSRLTCGCVWMSSWSCGVCATLPKWNGGGGRRSEWRT
jgi:hypothetical protein